MTFETERRMTMAGFNLPPGCSVSDIPGNRPEDEKIEAAYDLIDELLFKARLSPEEVVMAVKGGIAFVLAGRDIVDEMVRSKEMINGHHL